ncbi:MAG: hypothetical protein EOO43_19060 [Flavobacterium sp.]|nr:MAG: hypothetical protein EOO43_19060 [Flavobacterium sp.]
MKNLVVFVCIFLFFGCDQKTPKFILRPDKAKAYSHDNISYYTEVVIIANPPSNTSDLINLISRYNERTVSKFDIEQHYDVYIRDFYKESADTPVDFQDDDGFSPNLLGDHVNDFICSLKMKSCGIGKKQIHEWSLSSGFDYVTFDPIFYGQRCN